MDKSAPARRRLALLSSHLRPATSPLKSNCFNPLEVTNCTSSSNAEHTENGCIFCKIVRGESPAIKVVASMFSKVPAISSAVIKATGCDSFNLLVNNGEAAGQVVFHTHIHIIPRKASDCLWASESLRRRPLKLDQEAKKLGENIRENLPSLGNIEDSKGQVSDLIN
ncbi:adenylylsulfatase HINT3 isoform X2 [Nicotiana tabacum]|uniref:Adenylylsulfatase HINT3 isoform X2 n=1 Tax=Nicotiana tabacum TaxID=4097 RepID=A0AC58TT27_TOBAC